MAAPPTAPRASWLADETQARPTALPSLLSGVAVCVALFTGCPGISWNVGAESKYLGAIKTGLRLDLGGKPRAPPLRPAGRGVGLAAEGSWWQESRAVAGWQSGLGGQRPSWSLPPLSWRGRCSKAEGPASGPGFGQPWQRDQWEARASGSRRRLHSVQHTFEEARVPLEARRSVSAECRHVLFKT